MTRRPAPILLVLFLQLAGCSTSPPEVVCPKGVGNAVDMCSFAGATAVVEATVEAWANTSRVVDLAGFPDTVVTPISLNITKTLKGPLSGKLSALLVGCVSGDGSSIQGPLQTAEGKSSGYFFIVEADDYAVVVNQGFFRRDGNLLKNPGVASEGLTETDFRNRLHCGDAGL
ncbi:MAG: hypothetical protein QM765_52650 [Myxococcales bacterium]